MTQQQKDNWLEALRSGKYQQGTGDLMTESTGSIETQYCCLGVYCVVNHIDPETWAGNGCIDWRTELGTTSEDAPLNWHSALTHKNDILGEDFQQIAQYIEENIPSNEAI